MLPASGVLNVYAAVPIAVTPDLPAVQLKERSIPAADVVALTPALHLTAPTGISSTPLFGCSYARFAWGEVFRGFVVDDAGRVWSFKHDKVWNPRPAFDAGPADGAGIWWQRAELLSMYSPAESGFALPVVEVAKYRELIDPARHGKISSVQAAVDAGGSSCEAYFWDAAQDAYFRVELGSRGDFDIVNDAEPAHALSRWLRGVERSLAQVSTAKDVLPRQSRHRH
jgi:hypothetical protein